MQRLARYKEVAEQLIAAGHAYYDYMTREELELLRKQQIQRGEKPRMTAAGARKGPRGKRLRRTFRPWFASKRRRRAKPAGRTLSKARSRFRTPSSTTSCCCAPTAYRPTTSAW
jgi:glutamyl/glutaminyl-tRNA synthetase